MPQPLPAREAVSALTGAEALVGSFVAAGVDTCFANPGTSEMHAVAAIDAEPGLRAVLGLFEGVVTGAADGYARMAGRPAAVLLHLGPGLGNGVANLHNARRARVPVVTVVGDHATYHKRLDAPLESDIDALAGAVSGWVRRSWRPGDVGRDAVAAVAAAQTPPGRVATLILPADASWGGGGEVAGPVQVPVPAPVPDAAVDAAAKALSAGASSVLLVGGVALASQSGVSAAAAVAEATGARILTEGFPARLRRGAGLPAIAKLAYFAEDVGRQLAGANRLVLAGATPPVAFFAYPGQEGELVPDGCGVDVLAAPGDDAVDALIRLAERVGAKTAAAPGLSRPTAPDGPLGARALATAIAATLPDEAVVVEEAVTSGGGLAPALAVAPPHDSLSLTGGAIGWGLPAATGAAVACPDRPVLCVEADGSAMYTIQALWTQAREGLDVTTVICDNRSYAILRVELGRVGGAASDSALFDLATPRLDFVALAEGMGVQGRRATTGAELAAALADAYAEPGPHLIDAVFP